MMKMTQQGRHEEQVMQEEHIPHNAVATVAAAQALVLVKVRGVHQEECRSVRPCSWIQGVADRLEQLS